MTWKIEPSFGVDACVNTSFGVDLSQERQGVVHTLTFNRDEVGSVIEILKSVLKEAETLHEQELANE